MMRIRKLVPGIIIFIWLLWALLGSVLPLQPNVIDLPHILSPPAPGNGLGTDDLGRSVFQRLLIGAQVSLTVALLSVAISAVIGTLLGLSAGYIGGWWDRLISRLIEVFLAFPGILLAIALASMIGPGLDNVIIALSVMGWVGYARLVRVQVLSLKHRDHVAAAKALGQGHTVIMWRHILPLVLAPVWIEISYGIGGAIVAEASLSFLGLGVQAPDASWGGMIREGVRYLLVAPHLVLTPGIALCLVVIAVNLLGDQLRDRLDVTAHGRQ